MTQAAAPIFSPKPFQILFTGLAVMVLTIGVARLAGYQAPSYKPSDTVEAARVLKFEDGASGVVIVRDKASGDKVAQFGKGEGSFVRSTLRALVHDRQRKGLTSNQDFRLERHANAQLFLIDEATGKAISLNAFGPDNTAAFAAFLPTPNKGEGQ
jgi:putative photosynthetic complex assembly protein